METAQAAVFMLFLQTSSAWHNSCLHFVKFIHVRHQYYKALSLAVAHCRLPYSGGRGEGGLDSRDSGLLELIVISLY